MINPTETITNPEAVVEGFAGLAFSRSRVRLDFRNYWNGNHADSLGYYRQDRNRIRRDTRRLEKVWDRIRWRNKADLASALLQASRCTRLDYLGGSRGYDNFGNVWGYTAGQYQPTEIRWACADVCERAERILAKL